ncbi:MAG: CDP-diacylglycerol--glycerol-3-phosphate 3-phosphatidyltransferase [Acholeplasmatales bacterium]|nr:CDP-diacylglycerol--glycerol-3-phosphate 3-phosphatidyltransferase [Acholeplasmatales bacterium]
MNLPNKLTLLRILIVPVMIILFYIPWLKENYLFSYEIDGHIHGVTWLYFIELLLFAIASITDLLDGKIARSRGLVTNFGKFADPLADKILVFSAMALLMLDGSGLLPKGPLVPLWVFVVMLIREFAVSGLRMIAARKGETIAAGKAGKWKTAVTMVAIIVLFLGGLHDAVIYAGQVLIYISAILTIISGVEYFIKGKDFLKESE